MMSNATDKKATPTPAQMGINKLAANATKVDQSIWCFKMELFIDKYHPREWQRHCFSLNNSAHTTLAILDSIEPAMLHKIFSDRKKLHERMSTDDLWNFITDYIKRDK